MESLIPIINQLQDVCITAKVPLQIDLPQIVVVGSQSSGKSSLIESIVKREFLPRGPDIVTRRPLIIRLFKIDDENSDWVKFHHLPDKEFRDFDEVREEIKTETERLCGPHGISSEPITLSVFSKNIVNLTFIDLPGLVAIRLSNQPEDIDIQIEDVVKSYISNPNSIILAVTAANMIFANSISMRLAGQIDPEGKRTLAVITHLDIMNPGTDAFQLLTGNVMPVRLGIIGIVNRNQQEILDKKPIQKTIEDEARFLKKHYPTIADKHGQPYLEKRLHQLLMRHIRDCLPDLKERINSLLSQYQAKLDSYGEPVTDKATTVFDLITKFSQSYCVTIKGAKGLRTTEICGGARIEYIFHDIFERALSDINPLENLDNKAILTAARNAAGVRGTFSLPDVFELLVASQIKRLEDPSLRCVKLVHEEMGRFVKHCGDEVQLGLFRFPKLRENIEEILTKLLDQRLLVTREAVKTLVDHCLAFIDIQDSRFRESFHEPPPSSKTNTQLINDKDFRREKDLKECEYIARMINVYFNILRQEFKASVPRAIMHCIVNYITSNIQSVLVKEIYHKELFDELLSESDDIIRKKEETIEMLANLKQAGGTINTIDYP